MVSNAALLKLGISMISKDMTIDHLMSSYPAFSQSISQYLKKMGLSCVGCSAASYETIEVGILSHGYSEDVVEKTVNALNKIISKKISREKISLTDNAAAKFLSICTAENCEGYGLRFSIKPGGCSGYEYILDFASSKSPDEREYVEKGVSIFVKEAELDMLMGSEIDYLDGLQESGFKITNPNAKSACSCGKSQSM